MDLKVEDGCVPSATTGIFARALKNGRWDSVDIAELDKASLLAFLLRNPAWPVNIVGLLLGHGYFFESAGPHRVGEPEGEP